MRRNPYFKRQQDPQGRVCYYIYNDDGSPAIGATGARFCFSEGKAEEIVQRLNKQLSRSAPRSESATAPSSPPKFTTSLSDIFSRTGDRPRPSAPPPVSPSSDEATHPVRVGDIFNDRFSFYRVASITAKMAVLDLLKSTLQFSDATGATGRLPDLTSPPTGQMRRAIRVSNSGLPYFAITSYAIAMPWDGNVVINYSD